MLGPVASDLDQSTLGGQPDRQMIVKWAGNDAAVLDMQGPARYITRGGESIAGFAPEVHDALLAQGQRLGSDASGNLRLFEIDARTALAAKLHTLSQGEIIAPDESSVSLPLKFEGGLSLLGYDLNTGPDRSVDLVTYWRVDDRLASNQSIFAHVIDQAGQTLAQQDGLNVRASTLEAGDVILQHFVIDRLTGAEALEIGLYDRTDGHRFLANQSIDRVRLILK